MLKLEDLHLNQYFNENGLVDFEVFANNACNNYKMKFDFLGIKQDYWEELFLKAIKRNLGKELLEHDIILDIENIVSKTIRDRFTANSASLLNSWLRQLSSSCENYPVLLKDFVRAIGEYDIKLNETLYEDLKKYSPYFNYILNRIGILAFSFTEFENYLDGKYDIYLKVKISDISLSDCVELADYFFKILGISKAMLDKGFVKLSNDVIYKVRTAMRNYKLLEEIYDFYIHRFKFIKKEQFCKVIFGYSIKDFDRVFEDYKLYKLTSDIKYLDFMYRIDSSQKSELDVNIVSDDVEKTAKINYAALYELFEPIKGYDISISHHLVNLLIEDLELDVKMTLRYYGKRKLVNGKSICMIIKKLQKKYNKRVKAFLNKRTIDDIVPEVEGISKDQRKRFIDSWLQSLELNEKKQIESYLEGDIYLPQKAFESSEVKVDNFLNNYNKLIERAVNPSSIYSLVEPQVYMNEWVKREIVDKVFLSFDEEIRRLIKDYLEGLRYLTPKELFLVGQRLSDFKRGFEQYVSMVDSIVIYFSTIVLIHYKVSLAINLSFSKKYALARELMEVQAVFKDTFDVNIRKYREFWINNVVQLYENDSSISLEELIRQYIDILKLEIKLNKETVAL